MNILNYFNIFNRGRYRISYGEDIIEGDKRFFIIEAKMEKPNHDVINLSDFNISSEDVNIVEFFGKRIYWIDISDLSISKIEDIYEGVVEVDKNGRIRELVVSKIVESYIKTPGELNFSAYITDDIIFNDSSTEVEIQEEELNEGFSVGDNKTED